MSLYNFFETNIEENPELISTNAAKSLSYKDLYSHFRNRMNKLPIENFLDILYTSSIIQCSSNLREYEILRLKLKKIGYAVNRLYESAVLLEKKNNEALVNKV